MFLNKNDIPTHVGIRHVLSLLLLLLLAQLAVAQEIPVGTWRLHPSFRQMTALADAGEWIYAASTNGLMRYRKADGEVQTIDKTDGLTGNNFSALGWHEPSKTLVIGYTDGQIDLLSDETVVNIRTLATAPLVGIQAVRRINHILVQNNFAYLSLPFGIAVVDMNAKRLRENYLNLGSNGETVAIFQTAILRDSLFAATSQGLRATSLAASVNRLDFRNWRTVFTSTNLRTVAAAGNLLLAGVDFSDVFRYDNGKWARLQLPAAQYNHIALQTDGATICLADGRLIEWTTTGQTQIITHAALRVPRQSLRAGTIRYVADFESGLLQINGAMVRNLSPEGLFSPLVRRTAFINGNIMAFYGGFTANGQPENSTDGFSVFSAGKWINYNNAAGTLPPVRDWLTAVAADAERVWLASFADGLWTWQLAENRLQRATDAPNVRISGIADDQRGGLWLTALGTGSNPSVFRRAPNGSWRAYSTGAFNGNNALAPTVDDAGNAWIPFNPAMGGGLAIVAENGRVRLLGTQRGQGALPSPNVLALANDREGAMWVGTDNGIAVFFDAASAVSNNADAQRVVFNSRELLRGETIYSIAIDGGNRKWIGTARGAWLFSADGSQEIYHFTAANSPLLSDEVRHISIHPQTGEVFFSTDKGLVSFRGTATDAGRTFAEVRVFPNPVPPNFSGLITLDGLAANAIVKITDAAGRLVYETRAEGGTAVWNGLDYQGRTTRSGVYFVYAANANGEERMVTKFVKVE
jgi:hypothetical protein